MDQQELITHFLMFGTAVLLGFLIGLERSMADPENPQSTIRDFVIAALLGATSAFVSAQYDNSWLIAAGLIATLTLILAEYWSEHRRDVGASPGITTEAAAVLTFFLGVMVIKGAAVLATAVAIVLLITLSE